MADHADLAKILIVDDEPANVRLLERLLGAAGYRCLESTTDSREALARFRAMHPDLVLLDLMMPHLDGIAVLEQLKAEVAGGDYVPMLVLTADVTLEAKRRALSAGASDFLTKPFEQIEVVLRISNLLKTRRLYRALDAQNRSLEQMVRERTERLLQSEKVATMGSLLAGVAHELNNPLAVLSGHAQLLREGADTPALVRRAEKITEAGDRCVRIVRNFLALARQHPPVRSEVRVHRLVAGATELLAYQLRSTGVEVAVDVPETLPAVWGDPHQLHQVLVNLMSNAQQAMRSQSSPRRITVSACHDSERDQVRLVVADTGPGIPPDIRAKVFEPFFTTKPVGEGTGLGLSLSRGIIESHGGTIEIESAPGQGTRFVMELAVGSGTASPAAEPVAEAPPAISPKTILVIDDEAEVARVLAEALTRDGHSAEIAPNGAVALEMLRAKTYDLLVSDTKMPVLDGEAFYARLTHDFPDVSRRIMFLTGDVLSRDKREFLERTGAPVITKPFDLEEVRRLVRRLLASRKQP